MNFLMMKNLQQCDFVYLLAHNCFRFQSVQSIKELLFLGCIKLSGEDSEYLELCGFDFDQRDLQEDLSSDLDSDFSLDD